MFKKYRFKWKDGDSERSVDFFVHSKGTRNGFMHRACAIGPLPRLDEKDADYYKYQANNDKEFASRVAKVSYLNRTWESWPGQNCLSELWAKLSKLKFIDMGRICESNPFKAEKELEHERLDEPDELFDGFRR